VIFVNFIALDAHKLVSFIWFGKLDIIFDLTGGSDVLPRTLANVINIYYNPVLYQQWAIQKIIKPGHDCSTIMDWPSTREKVPSDITALIGEIIKMYLYYI
jgi:hypothetical protein